MNKSYSKSAPEELLGRSLKFLRVGVGVSGVQEKGEQSRVNKKRNGSNQAHRERESEKKRGKVPQGYSPSCLLHHSCFTEAQAQVCDNMRLAQHHNDGWILVFSNILAWKSVNERSKSRLHKYVLNMITHLLSLTMYFTHRHSSEVVVTLKKKPCFSYPVSMETAKVETALLHSLCRRISHYKNVVRGVSNPPFHKLRLVMTRQL